jgi:hypothetical protein
MSAGVHFAEMIAVADAEAHRIVCSQDALVKARLRLLPAASELRRADVFRAIVRLIECVRADRTIIERLKRIRG